MIPIAHDQQLPLKSCSEAEEQRKSPLSAAS